jgi:hypothetical protein
MSLCTTTGRPLCAQFLERGAVEFGLVGILGGDDLLHHRHLAEQLEHARVGAHPVVDLLLDGVPVGDVDAGDGEVEHGAHFSRQLAQAVGQGHVVVAVIDALVGVRVVLALRRGHVHLRRNAHEHAAQHLVRLHVPGGQLQVVDLAGIAAGVEVAVFLLVQDEPVPLRNDRSGRQAHGRHHQCAARFGHLLRFRPQRHEEFARHLVGLLVREFLLHHLQQFPAPTGQEGAANLPCTVGIGRVFECRTRPALGLVRQSRLRLQEAIQGK